MFDNNDQNQPAVNTTTPTMPADQVPPVAPPSPDPFSAPAPAPEPTISAPSAPIMPDPISQMPVDDTSTSPAMPDPIDVSAPNSDNTSTPVVDTPVTEDTSNTTSDFSANTPSSDNSELMSIKQGALQDLSPLLSHLDQSPEEKFRTTMMLIQASDDQSLIQTAYSSAKEIGDEKIRAQALLDIVNEINYFTQQKPAS